MISEDNYKIKGCLRTAFFANYYAFGMPMPGRNMNFGEYRYGYQGSEKDDEVSGEGNSYTTEYRQLDVRLGRWFSVDPMAAVQPWITPYSSMNNNPINLNDVLGDLPNNGGIKEKLEDADAGTVTEDGKLQVNTPDGGSQILDPAQVKKLYHKDGSVVQYEDKLGNTYNWNSETSEYELFDPWQEYLAVQDWMDNFTGDATFEIGFDSEISFDDWQRAKSEWLAYMGDTYGASDERTAIELYFNTSPTKRMIDEQNVERLAKYITYFEMMSNVAGPVTAKAGGSGSGKQSSRGFSLEKARLRKLKASVSSKSFISNSHFKKFTNSGKPIAPEGGVFAIMKDGSTKFYQPGAATSKDAVGFFTNTPTSVQIIEQVQSLIKIENVDVVNAIKLVKKTQSFASP